MNRTVQFRCAALLSLSVVLISTPAWAVVGEVEVTVSKPDGEVVAGATVSLGGQEVTTGSDGTAVLSVEEGEQVLEVQVVDGVSYEQTVTVTPGQKTDVPVMIDPIRPWMVQNPGGLLGGFVLGPVFATAAVDNMTFTEATDTFMDTVGGTPLPPVVVENDLEAFNEAFDPNVDIDLLAVDFAVGLPKTAKTGTRLYSALVLILGQGDVNLEFRNNSAPDSTNNYDGDGLLWGLGYNGVIVPNDRTRWYVQFGLSYSRLDEIDVTRKPALSGADSDDVTFAYDGFMAQTTAGYAFKHVAPFFGVRYIDKEAELRGNVFADFGGGDTVRILFVNKMEADEVVGLLGVDVRFPGTRLLARVQGTSGSDSSSVFAKLVYAFGFANKKKK